MVVLYSGTPGSGKSLYAAYKIIQTLNKRLNVIANFDIDNTYFFSKEKFVAVPSNLRKIAHLMPFYAEACKSAAYASWFTDGGKIGRFTYKSDFELTPDFLRLYAKRYHKANKEHQTLVVIDESIAFNPATSDPNLIKCWVLFLKEHRKLGYDIILITQNDRLLARPIRAFIETEFKHRNVKSYKLFGKFLSSLTGGLFCRVECWYGNRNIKCGSEYFILNRKKASIYNTYEIF